MITPEEFPYIKSLYVNDCYAYKDFNIELHDYKPFSHLILTGKNGSGKSTILRVIDKHIRIIRGEEGGRLELLSSVARIEWLKEVIADRTNLYGTEDSVTKARIDELIKLERAIPTYVSTKDDIWMKNKGIIVYSFLEAKRES